MFIFGGIDGDGRKGQRFYANTANIVDEGRRRR